MTYDLGRCPFCGGDAGFFTTINSSRGPIRGFEFGIRCKKCGVGLPHSDYKLELQLAPDGVIITSVDDRRKAAAAWNQRYDSQLSG